MPGSQVNGHPESGRTTPRSATISPRKHLDSSSGRSASVTPETSPRKVPAVQPQSNTSSKKSLNPNGGRISTQNSEAMNRKGSGLTSPWQMASQGQTSGRTTPRQSGIPRFGITSDPRKHSVATPVQGGLHRRSNSVTDLSQTSIRFTQQNTPQRPQSARNDRIRRQSESTESAVNAPQSARGRSRERERSAPNSPAKSVRSRSVGANEINRQLMKTAPANLSSQVSAARKMAKQEPKEIMTISRGTDGKHRLTMPSANSRHMNGYGNGTDENRKNQRMSITPDRILPDKPKILSRSNSQSTDASSTQSDEKHSDKDLNKTKSRLSVSSAMSLGSNSSYEYPEPEGNASLNEQMERLFEEYRRIELGMSKRDKSESINNGDSEQVDGSKDTVSSECRSRRQTFQKARCMSKESDGSRASSRFTSPARSPTKMSPSTERKYAWSNQSSPSHSMHHLNGSSTSLNSSPAVMRRSASPSPRKLVSSTDTRPTNPARASFRDSRSSTPTRTSSRATTPNRTPAHSRSTSPTKTISTRSTTPIPRCTTPSSSRQAAVVKTPVRPSSALAQQERPASRTGITPRQTNTPTSTQPNPTTKSPASRNQRRPASAMGMRSRSQSKENVYSEPQPARPASSLGMRTSSKPTPSWKSRSNSREDLLDREEASQQARKRRSQSTTILFPLSPPAVQDQAAQTSPSPERPYDLNLTPEAIKAKPRKDGPGRCGPRTRIPLPKSSYKSNIKPFDQMPLRRYDSGVDINNMSPTDPSPQEEIDWNQPDHDPMFVANPNLSYHHFSDSSQEYF